MEELLVIRPVFPDSAVDCTGISLIQLAAGMVLEGFRWHAKMSAVLSVMRVVSGQTTRDPIHAVIPDESFLQPLRRSV